jgi:hypothetical protein
MRRLQMAEFENKVMESEKCMYVFFLMNFVLLFFFSPPYLSQLVHLRN